MFSSFDPADTNAGGDQGIALESFDGQGNYHIRSKEGDTFDNIYIPQTAVSTLNTTDWFHFAVVRDTSNNINLYVNGVKGTTAVANTYTFNHSQYGVIYVGKSLASGNFFEGNIVKYITRHRKKGEGSKDIEKAIHYLEMILEMEYGKE